MRLGAAVVLVAGALSGTAEARTRCPTDAIPVALGADLGRLARQSPRGASFCIAPGVHRMQAVTPRDGQRFYGERGAVLNGARRLTAFSRRGAHWVATGQDQEGPRLQGQNCLPAFPRCHFPEAVYIDDAPLRAVGRIEDLAPGRFYFDYAADEIYLADDPGGRMVEASVSPFAFEGGAKDVTVSGLRVEKYANPIQLAAVGYGPASPGWTVERNEVRLNHGVGVTVGSGGRIRDNLVRDNGEMGIGCVGDDILIEGNEIAANGWWAGLDPGWEGGGGKCALTRRLTVRGNFMHGNNAYGFWTDIDNIDTLYEDNRVERNASGGLSHEISYRAVIRNNRFAGNGYDSPVWLWGGAIQIQNSREVEVYGNVVDMTDGGNGICLIQQNRGKGAYGPHATVNNSVHHNVVISRKPDRGSNGAVADFDLPGMRAGNNRFEHNTYRLFGTGNDQWAWVDGFYTWDEYRRRSGQDGSSRLIDLRRR